MKVPAHKSFAALAILLTLPTAASAQSQSVRQACRADFDKLCSGVTPGGGKVAACLKQQSDKLSSECKEALKSAKAE